MQQQIRSSHFSRATLYVLMANCLQFQKEGQANPGNAGSSKTRAMVCELLAIKLLREYNTRELIDALSYDFYPLQGLDSSPQGSTPNLQRNMTRGGAARTSTLEVAIRASAKKFLAHPVVVQQLEAIWAGTIVFHSAADNLHRKQAAQTQKIQAPAENTHLLVPGQNPSYGSSSRTSPGKQVPVQAAVQSRRTVTLYDPRDASLFKLSRLRVPRYRQFFSTCSLAILLGLFLAVLSERSMDITTLEVVFWLWSAGFMLDEIVGFNEQGFSLYIMSFWNAFDVGILLLLILYYCMRLYGIFLVDVGRHQWNDMAYDVLATNAVLLFPRLFSVLDHYRYFSQLLIAFRLMAIDLVAVSVLILIACSGFFVAFTLSFGKNQYDAAGMAYIIFKILMGFTPAAWEAWDTYNPLGRAILVLFLFICHFLVVTILITVLTNSFMAIVSNANEEHQFVFAVNTISMVKNDALFSYVAPTNLIAWTLTPLMFCLPFRTFIKLNRTVIKITHFVLLFGIYTYEKTVLASSVFEATDLIANPAGVRKRLISFQDKSALFSPRINRGDSVAGFQKDTALEEVFRLAPRPSTIKGYSKTQTNSVVKNWMEQGGEASSPQEQDRSVVDRLEQRRRSRQATLRRKRAISGTRSVASDPAEFMSSTFHEQPDGGLPTFSYFQPDADDGDDELLTNEDPEEGMTLDKRTTRTHHFVSDRDATSDEEDEEEEEEDYFQTPNTTKSTTPRATQKIPKTKLSPPKSSPPRRRPVHSRNISTATILYNPTDTSTSPPLLRSRPSTAKTRSKPPTGSNTPQISGNRSPKPVQASATKAGASAAKARPIMPNRQAFQSMPNFHNFHATGNINNNNRERNNRPTIRHRRSSLDMGMSDLGLDTLPHQNDGMVPSSFATQMAMATNFGGREAQRMNARGENTEAMMGRLMLARMKTLEEGFADVVREFREMGMRTEGNSIEGSVGSVRWKGKGRRRDSRRESEESPGGGGGGGGNSRDEYDYEARDRRYVSKGSSL